MAVVSRVAKLRMQDATNANSSEWLATAAVQDTPAGDSVVITVTKVDVGTAPPFAPNTLALNLYNDAGGLIRTISLAPGSSSQTVTFHFTDNGQSGGAARIGTVEIAIRATRTDLNSYDVETDGTPNTPPTGFTSVLDRGWIRGTTTLIESISNVSLGGGKSQPAEFDESLFVRTTVGAMSYINQALTVALSAGGLSGSTNSTMAVQRDATFVNVVDDRFPAAVTTVDITVTVPNSTLTGQPAWAHTSITDDSINVDPRLTASHHFQTEENAFAVSKNNLSKSMLSTQSGYLATRFVTARTGSGVNGLTVVQTLTPVLSGQAVSSSTTTATRDGQAGWSGFLDWVSSKPGGTWNKTVDITAPLDIDPDAYILNGTDAYVLLAPDPRIVIRGYLNVTAGARHHFTAGTPVMVSAVIEDITTGVRVEPSRVTDVGVALRRFDSATERFEYLDETLDWNLWEAAEAEHFFALVASANDPRAYIKSFTAAETLNWTKDVRLTFRCKVDGTPYAGFSFREEAGNLNRHDRAGGSAFDPVAFALNNVISFK